MKAAADFVWRRRRDLLVLAAVALALALFYSLVEGRYIYDANKAFLAGIGAIALNLLTGYAGQASIGNAAFLAIGAYTVVIVDPHVGFPFPILVGALAAGAVGFLIGLPSLRLRGLYLIFSTLALQFVVEFFTEDYDSRTGALGGHFVDSPTLGPLHLDDDRTWFVFLAIVLAIVALFVRNIVNGSPGRAWGAVRANEAAAAVAGVNVTRAKLAAFTTSSCIIGFAGALGAYFLQVVGYTYFNLDLAVSYIAMILIGGLVSIWGSIIGAIVVTMIPVASSNIAASLSASGSGGFIQRNVSAINLAVYALAIIVFLYLRPGGIASLGKILTRRRTSIVRNPRGAPRTRGPVSSLVESEAP